MIARLRSLWPVLALLASASMLAAAHGFERIGGLQPCPLCLDQRNWHWAVVGAALAAIAAGRFIKGRARLIAAILGLLLLGSFAMAAYHVAVEQHWVVAQCDIRTRGDFSFDLDDELVIPKCDEIAWQMFGVSMAGYNALISLALALTSFALAFWPEKKDG